MATISVPQLELDAAVYEGVTSVLDTGPGHWPGTAASAGTATSSSPDIEARRARSRP
ncbi:MAG: hypothetical protein ACXW2Y_00080 [Acidimicrobiia bacterium]